MKANLIVDRLVARRAPALTWYGDGRIELGGPVVANWLSKTLNLLAEEYHTGWGDDSVGSFAVVGAPTWRSTLWQAALWLDRWPMIHEGGASALSARTWPHLVLTAAPDDPSVDPSTDVPVALSPGGMDLAWPGPLPDGAVDGIADVAGYPDVLVVEPPETGSAPALVDDPASLDQLVSAVAAADAIAAVDGGRVTLSALRAWSEGRGLVVIDTAVNDADAVARILGQERLPADALG